MSKVFYGALLVAALAALAFVPSCKGSKSRQEGCGGCASGCADACGCGAGAACGCGGCGCGAKAACGCGGCGTKGCGCGGCGAKAACGCGGCGCGAKAACGCGCGCGAKGCGECGCGGCGCGCGCGVGGAMPVADADARHAMRLYRRYLIWGKLNAKPFKSKAHGRHDIQYYANKVARETLKSGGAYPVGATFAKEGWKDGKRKLVWLMEKRAAGYDVENGDWWYATVDDKGKVLNGGSVKSCIQCHDTAHNDYVFGLPK